MRTWTYRPIKARLVTLATGNGSTFPALIYFVYIKVRRFNYVRKLLGRPNRQRGLVF